MGGRGRQAVAFQAFPMWRVLFLFSVLPIAAAAAARWYFGFRVLTLEGGRLCRCDPGRWPFAEPAAPSAEESAHEFGRQLRASALGEWHRSHPKAAASRQGSKRFGMAVPPLSAMVAVFALIVAKIPVMDAISILLASTAISCAIGLLSIPAELAAIARAARRLKDARSFARRDDEDAIIRCALAHAWSETLPPIISMIQR